MCVGKIFDIGFACRLCGWRVMLVSCNVNRRMRRIERHAYLKKLKLHDLCKHHKGDTGDRSSKWAGWLAGLNLPAYPVTVFGSIRQILNSFHLSFSSRELRWSTSLSCTFCNVVGCCDKHTILWPHFVALPCPVSDARTEDSMIVGDAN